MKIKRIPGRTLVGITLSCLLGAIPPLVEADGFTGNIRVLAGQKQLDEDDWKALDRQDEIGLLFDIKKKQWPVSIAIDLLGAGDQDTGAGIEDTYTFEQHFGIRKTWQRPDSKFQPYVGGGVALIEAGIEPVAGAKETDREIGAWIGGGAYWMLTSHVNVGFDVRFSAAEVELRGRDYQAGGTHYGLTLGYRW